MSTTSQYRAQLRDRPIDAILEPFHQFFRTAAAGGILLLACAAIGVAWANSPWSASYEHFWHMDLRVGFGTHGLELSLAHFVNDGLMAIFFFVVGLEIKREFIAGELASPRRAAVPIAAAVGGMVAPALIYFALNAGQTSVKGWAIPMATDIAFAIGVLAMLGPRVPVALKVFLTALAIVDDIGAVIVIALFYTHDLSLLTLGGAFAALALSIGANRLGIRTPIVYAVLGAAMWVLLLRSGVHATIGGVLLALTIPSRMRIRGAEFATFARSAVDSFERAGAAEGSILTNPAGVSSVHALERACEHVLTPLSRLEHRLHPWVAFVIMPIFALANAGVAIGPGFGSALGSGVGIGVVLGLVLGKPIGIMLATLVTVKAGLGRLPAGSSWKQVFGASCLAGIGFTMSLFITNLAFRDGADLEVAKAAILCASLVSGIVGFVLLRATTRPAPRPAPAESAADEDPS